MFGLFLVATGAPSIKVGNPEYNADAICDIIAAAERNKAALLVLPKMCLTGVTCGDLLLMPDFLRRTQTALAKIEKFTESKNTLVLLGTPVIIGGKMASACAVILSGKIIGIVPDGTSAIFKDRNSNFSVAVASLIPAQYNKLSGCAKTEVSINQNPAETFSELRKASIIAELGGHTELVGFAEKLRAVAIADTSRLNCSYIYSGAGSESSSGGVYSGRKIIAECGEVLHEGTDLFGGNIVFSEIDCDAIAYKKSMHTLKNGENFPPSCTDIVSVTEIDLISNDYEPVRKINPSPFIPIENFEKRVEEILYIQSAALAARLKSTNSNAVIGISGGLDSTLAMLVIMRAYDLINKDRTEILGISMPGLGTSVQTKGSAALLVKQSGATFRLIDISSCTKLMLKSMEHDGQPDVTFENAQARMRTNVLMNLANSTKGIVIGTGDMSELALGWCTYGGDQMSMFAVNSTVPKTLVKELVRYESKRLSGAIGKTLEKILETDISPELLPLKDGKIAQKTEDILGAYEIHDFYIYHRIGRGASEEKLLYLAKRAFNCKIFAAGTDSKYSVSDLKRCLEVFSSRFYSQQFKRTCAPDGVKTGNISLLGDDFCIPGDLQN